MCGRYAQVTDPATLAAEFDAADRTDGGWGGPDHNVAPGATVPAVLERRPCDASGTQDRSRRERSLRLVRWGLVPPWARDTSVGDRLVNARAETLTEKPAYRTAAAARRCLLPADGWFVWRRGSGPPGRTPYFATLPAGPSLALAGLWETWRPEGSDAPPLVSAVVITTAATGPLSEIHHRMPLVLPAERWADWLDPDRNDPTDLLAPPPDELLAALEIRQVSSEVDHERDHGPELVEEHVTEPEQTGLDLEDVGVAGDPA